MPAMVPPRWSGDQGRPLLTYPCSRRGREVAVRFRGFRVENLKHVVNRRMDGSLYTEEQTITPVTGGAGVVTHFIAVK
jgi:hypothetical protein